MIPQLEPPVNQRIPASPAQIAEFCQRWQINEFALFGSVLRDDFRPDSDIDVLLTFSPEQWLTWDDWQTMQTEIETLFKRKVDLVSKQYLKNPYRRHEILNTCQVIYAIEQP
ncbi:dna polymerase beta domain-containing protein [Gloeomargarita lithophora Alchichica-D10]|uniref:Dna polymerase beta domain-containing protein n=1 Tax=Gloeomargarita lithophora Alchichica-D10 TaxID=1188229 RepID=A0A1J0AGG1_9CYAN|nr:nucleotidyltransferase domain-containing protein [Gloeomargarita lithophora]APB35042.1 dna polymerase beta domain-containing protein [Gloeomargarita lithophora Alchichica-D10]